MTIPGFWMNETSGQLRTAVEAYFLQPDAPMTPEHMAMLRAYLRQWMAADWKGGEALEDLRGTIDRLTSREALDAWLDLAFEINIDPF